MQENMNYNDRPEVLERIRDEERPTVVKSMEWCRQQHDDGNYYLIENPERSRIWSEESVLEMLEYIRMARSSNAILEHMEARIQKVNPLRRPSSLHPTIPCSWSFGPRS